ncbi:MAG: hypothetical protein V4640_14200 [Verrucomicrobiota bacterium]
METILLAWNPKRFPWKNLQDRLAEIRREGRATDHWSVGNRKILETGTRFFLIHLGAEPRGLVGSGWTTSAPLDRDHWDPSKAEQGVTARYASIYFDTLEEDPIVTMDELSESPFSKVHWSTQMSGIQIPELIAAEVETLWTKRTSEGDPGGMEGLVEADATVLKHSTRLYVNRYERNPRARALCLAKYGLVCSCCEVLLSDVYGSQAENLIHVHHLTPLSSIPEGFQIDPIADLRPVCPNCHNVIHSKPRPYTIDEVKEMIAETKQKHAGRPSLEIDHTVR